ncbi:MAG: sugar transferase [Prevotellaceae bacterium]|nr:sugar transferase [Prevotellaceae bacterium]
MRTKREIITTFLGEKFSSWLACQVDVENDKTAICATTQNVTIELLPHYSKEAIINLRKINDIAHINKFFELVNEKLSVQGIFIGIVETIEHRHDVIFNKYFFPVNYIVLVVDFFFNRVLPKIKLTQDVYYYYTKGTNRALSKAEVLGRLYSCGFVLKEGVFIDNHFVFCAIKEKVPLFDNHPTYGPFVALRRVGKSKKEVLIYKMRTMYPYSEYIQKYVYDMQGTSNGDKAENDFRITRWGKFFRKFWLDELPMFINLFKGDVKIVGVRPLSWAKFETYPKDLQDKRIRTKPGLIPPFYSDLPKTQEELFESEDRYLDAYFKAPLRTDIRYFFKAINNIVFKRARSK